MRKRHYTKRNVFSAFYTMSCIVHVQYDALDAQESAPDPAGSLPQGFSLHNSKRRKMSGSYFTL